MNRFHPLLVPTICATVLTACALLTFTATAAAQRSALKPSDLEPLTTLPWTTPGATLDTALAAIYREPHYLIRRAVLGGYLRAIPIDQLGLTFDLCIALEGTQTPEEFVQLFLEIWAERDPLPCWARTKRLFRLVGIEEGWLSYDHWQRPRLSVQDLKAIRSSLFWLTSRSLKSFPIGVAASSLPPADRVRVLREFSELWFRSFASWPGYSQRAEWMNPAWSLLSGNAPEMFRMFRQNPAHLRDAGGGVMGTDQEVAFEIRLRRWLEFEPAAALEIIKLAREKKWPPHAGRNYEMQAGPSTELLMVWARADLTAMLRWVETLDIRTDPVAITSKGILMSRVEPATRERWLKEASVLVDDEDFATSLLSEWAKWDPHSALAAAALSANPESIAMAAVDAAYGPGSGGMFNVSHHGLGVIKDFDLASLPEPVRKLVLGEWGVTIMEQWGDIDIGEAARYGLDFMLRNHYAPRENLIRLFAGDDRFASDSDMIDRTFCALRVWAVVRPVEMKRWIANLDDAEMRKALTWLLNNPWGGEAPKPQPKSRGRSPRR